jgi:hypothetical protein
VPGAGGQDHNVTCLEAQLATTRSSELHNGGAARDAHDLMDARVKMQIVVDPVTP